MTPGDSEITVERLQEIIELTLELEEEIPEEIGIIVQELVEEVVRLQLRRICRSRYEPGFTHTRKGAVEVGHRLL